MNDEQQAKIKEIDNLIFDAQDMLAELTGEVMATDKQKSACRELVDRISDEYRALKQGMGQMDQMQLQRKLGRKVADLRKQADWLPRKTGGSPIPMARDQRWVATADKLEGTAPGEEYRGPGTGPKVESYEAIVSSLRPRVGGSIEAWCGACKMLREHTISAMVNEEPKKVVCETCGAQHNYRLTPARSRKKSDSEPIDAKARGKAATNQDVTRRKEAERTALQQELVNATDVRPFKRRGRYKAGEIIDHPDHGRGKIENVLKGSLLVRFRAGLKPVDNF